MLGTLVLLLALLWFFWSWDWFLPLLDARLSATAGRHVSAQHLRVRLGVTTRVELDGVRIDEPHGFPETRPFATVRRLVITARPLDYLRGHGIVVPSIDLDGGDATIRGLADGRSNLDFAFMHATGGKPGPSPRIGVLSISDTHADIAWAKLRARFGLDIHTTGTGDGQRIVVAAKGTYAGQPITGHFAGGALLTLRDTVHPYPLELSVANGPTHVSLTGTVQDPLHFAGANVRLVFAGPDMALLFPLTGVPIPSTPPYQVAGKLDYTNAHIVFRDFKGTLGSSDLAGTITGDPHENPPHITADLTSRSVDLADLGGFIGGSPGHPSENKAAHRSATAAGGTNVLPTTPISLPKLKAANVDFRYRAGHIEGKSIPLDNLVTDFTIRDGVVDVHRLDFGVGRGTLASSARLAPAGKGLSAQAKIDVRRVDLSHLLNSTHVFHGSGIVGGQAELKGTGDSIADLVAHGSGGASIFMRDGGDVSALLPDIAGLEFSNALLSALGIPRRTAIQCFVAKLPLNDGILSTDLFVLQTKEARTTGTGTVNFRNDTLDYQLTTRSTGFSIGSLPGPIHVGGSLSSPSITPGAEVVARGAAATGLGIVFAPLAILPTIQLGVGESAACEEAVRASTTAPGTAATSGSTGSTPRARRLSPKEVHRAWERREGG